MSCLLLICIQIARVHSIVLGLTCASTLFFLMCCKLESCFPTRLDPESFEDLEQEGALPRVRPLRDTDVSATARWLRFLRKVAGTLMALPEWYELDEPASPNRK